MYVHIYIYKYTVYINTLDIYIYIYTLYIYILFPISPNYIPINSVAVIEYPNYVHDIPCYPRVIPVLLVEFPFIGGCVYIYILHTYICIYKYVYTYIYMYIQTHTLITTILHWNFLFCCIPFESPQDTLW